VPKIVRFHETGGAEVLKLEDLPLTEPGEGEVSRCPYKGEAHHYSVGIGDKLHKDVVWFYQYPAPDSAKVQGLLGFLNEKLDIYEDGKLLSRPQSPWS
jgi:uncharacterized protein (DUF427 family)